jgi:hypothetical protein
VKSTTNSQGFESCENLRSISKGYVLEVQALQEAPIDAWVDADNVKVRRRLWTGELVWKIYERRFEKVIKRFLWQHSRKMQAL